MIIKFFKRRDDNNEINVSDDYGEWLIIRKNKYAVTVKRVVDKTLKKLKIKDGNLGLISLMEDEQIKGLLSVKAMVYFREQIIDPEFYKVFKDYAEEYFKLGETRLSRLRICNTTFLFFMTNLLVKKVEDEEDSVKLLFPPKGIYADEIPYTLKELFSKIVERNLNMNCHSTTLTLSNNNLESVFVCKGNYNANLNDLKLTLSYFSLEPPNISIRTSNNTIEVSISITKFRSKYLIPFLWSNIIASNIVC